MRNFQLHVHPKSYNKKPKGIEVAMISKEITKFVSNVNAKELASLVGEQGHTVVLAKMKSDERKMSNIETQNVLMIDFDNTEVIIAKDGSKEKIQSTGLFYTSIADVLADEYAQNNAAFIYKSFSHEEGWDKFRLVFILDKALTTAEEVTNAYEFLFSKYPNADIACKDSSRLFFGGTQSVIEINFNNELEIDTIEYTEPVKSLIKPVKAVKKPSQVDKARKAVPVKTTGMEPSWKLLRDGKRDELKERWSVYGAKLHSKVQAQNYLKTINMAEMLGIEYNTFFDIFHTETTPSASIFKLEGSDIYLYKCHSGNHAFIGDITRVASKLTGMPYLKMLNELIDLCSIEIVVTEQIREIREQCDLFINLLVSEDLKESYPAIHERFWRYKTPIVTLMTILKENIYEDENGELRSLTWMSVRTLAKKIYGKESSYFTMTQLLNLLALTDWIDKLDDTQIPEKLLKELKKSQGINQRQKRSNVWELLKLGDDFFQQLNLKCKEMKQQGFTMKGLSREYVIRTHGIEKADKLYPQDTDRVISKKSDEIVSFLTETALKQIEKKGYVIVNDLLAKGSKKFKSKGLTELKFKQSIAQMIDGYGLKKVRLSKALKEDLNIKGLAPTAAPTALIKG